LLLEGTLKTQLDHGGTAVRTVPGTLQVGEIVHELDHVPFCENRPDHNGCPAGLQSAHVDELLNFMQFLLFLDNAHKIIHSQFFVLEDRTADEFEIGPVDDLIIKPRLRKQWFHLFDLINFNRGNLPLFEVIDGFKADGIEKVFIVLFLGGGVLINQITPVVKQTKDETEVELADNFEQTEMLLLQILYREL
jgi:hypothetical protein